MSEWSGVVERVQQAGWARDVGLFVEAWEAVFEAIAALHEQGDSLTAVTLLRVLREDLDAIVVPDLVAGAREQGASWADVGHAMGVSRQAARAKWREAGEG